MNTTTTHRIICSTTKAINAANGLRVQTARRARLEMDPGAFVPKTYPTIHDAIAALELRVHTTQRLVRFRLVARTSLCDAVERTNKARIARAPVFAALREKMAISIPADAVVVNEETQSIDITLTSVRLFSLSITTQRSATRGYSECQDELRVILTEYEVYPRRKEMQYIVKSDGSFNAKKITERILARFVQEQCAKERAAKVRVEKGTLLGTLQSAVGVHMELTTEEKYHVYNYPANGVPSYIPQHITGAMPLASGGTLRLTTSANQTSYPYSITLTMPMSDRMLSEVLAFIADKTNVSA